MRFLLTSYLIVQVAVSCVYSQISSTSQADGAEESHQVGIVVPKVSLVSITDNQPIQLSFTPPVESGNQIQSDTISTTWLNYSFIKGGSTMPVNHVFAHISNGQVPNGVDLVVTAGQYTGNGQGDHGVSSGAVVLSTTNQKVVEQIGSSYTGSGHGNGHVLTYQVSVSNYALLDFEQQANVQVVYTISE